MGEPISTNQPFFAAYSAARRRLRGPDLVAATLRELGVRSAMTLEEIQAAVPSESDLLEGTLKSLESHGLIRRKSIGKLSIYELDTPGRDLFAAAG